MAEAPVFLQGGGTAELQEDPVTDRRLAPSTTTPSSRDRLRQVVVTVSFLVCLLGSFVGIGALGGDEVEDTAGGALSDAATHIAPDGPAFSIWSVIYTGLALFVILQWLPRFAAQSRQRAVGYLVAASMVLNAAWIFATQGDLLWLSVLVILVLLAVLCRTLVLLHRERAENAFELVAVDGTLGLYLGWVTVATAANIAATLADSGFDGSELGPEVWAIIVLAALAVIGSLLAVHLGGRLAISAAIVGGLSWVAVGRASGELRSSVTVVAALVAAAVVVAATLYVRLRDRRA